ncbi:hypothetical protein AAFC00_001392 [Neodothiora populina]|uniref:UspA domain-containing protein n=1 Tax=Neodothiora populina TaxID=2781224 RepID=A0ABR3PP50_9PEZI
MDSAPNTPTAAAATVAVPSPSYSPTSGPSPALNGSDGANGRSNITTQNIPSQTSLAFVEPHRPSLTSEKGSDENVNRARKGSGSVQFLPHLRGPAAAHSRSRSRNVGRDGSRRRMSSPPPPEQFKHRVSFDTFDNRDASDFSLTLNRKHRDYEYTKRSRTFLCGTDANDYSDTALEWLIDELVDDGDEVVCLRVVEKDSKEALKWAGGGSGGREGRERAYRAEANKMITRIQEKNVEDRAINLVLEFSIGKVPDTIQHMIRLYEPAILVVGTRGRSLGGFTGLLPGSVSKYCLQHSPVPVIVVRPSAKRESKKKKRLLDPSRRAYRDILDKSDDLRAGDGGHILDHSNRLSTIPGDGLGTLAELKQIEAEEEARKVAEAVGYRQSTTSEGVPLSRVTSAKSDFTGRSSSFGSYRSDSPEALRSPRSHLMKSPELRGLDSPALSDSDDSSDSADESAVSAHVAAQEKSLREARERALKAEEEEREREREAKESKENKRRSQAPNGGGGAGALALLDALGGPDDTNKKVNRRTTDSKGRKLAGGYPIP